MRFQLDLTKEYGIVLEGGGARGIISDRRLESPPGSRGLRSAESRMHQWAP